MVTSAVPAILLADLFFMFMALIAQTSFFKGAFFFFCFQSQLWYFGGTAFFIKRYHSEECSQSPFFTFCFQVFDFYYYDYFHGAIADIDYLCCTDNQIADKNRQVEFYFVYPGCNNISTSLAACRSISRRIHQLDDLASVDIAGYIGLMRHHDLADDESAFRGCFFQDLEPAFLISEKIKSCIAQTLFIYVHIKKSAAS